MLHSAGLMDSAPDPRIDQLTKAAKLLFDAPIALVSLVDSDRQWFKSCIGLGVKQTSRSVAFSAYTIMPGSEDCFVVEDALTDPRFCNNPLVVGAPYIRYYVGAALKVQGVKIGSLCIIDTRPRKFLMDEFRRMMATLAQLASTVTAQMYDAAPAGTRPQAANQNNQTVQVEHGPRASNAAAGASCSLPVGQIRGPQTQGPQAAEVDSTTKPRKRQRRGPSAQHKVDVYAQLYARIMANAGIESVGQGLSDKELRILMRENKIMINTLNPITGKYIEKTKSDKLRALVPMLGQLIPPGSPPQPIFPAQRFHSGYALARH